MPFDIVSRYFDEVLEIVPKAFEDSRGFFMETYRADQFRDLGLPCDFVQDNHSFSKKGVIRGLHMQWQPAMGKLMRVIRGTAFLVAVDIRVGSPTVGKWVGIESSAENRKQVWAPASFARGFCALSDEVEVEYKCTGTYNSKAESAIRWNDAQIRIDWPVTNPILSDKDREAGTLETWLKSPDAQRFAYSSK
jgi:dTDP-4-dehydrorhamnose 3,5-epimerase